MLPETPKRHEHHESSSTRELEQHLTHFTGLHLRLMMNDQKYLNPNEKIIPDKNNPLLITTIQERDYTPFEDASKYDRKKYWQKNATKDAGFDENFDRWKKGAVKHVQALTEEKKETYFSLLSTLKIVPEEKQEFNEEHAQKLYDRYFSKSKPDEMHGVHLFVRDILANHQAEDGTIDVNKIYKQMPHIKDLAVIFGKESKNMIEHLILTEAQSYNLRKGSEGIPALSTENENFLKRLNDLNKDERQILEFIHKAQTAEYETSDNELPILKHKKEIQNAIQNNEFTVLIGGTGSGKTVGTPGMIREIMKENEHLIITEPTQINTQSLAESIAKFSDPPITVGQEIDFKHGDKPKYTDQADTLIMTERTLVNRLLDDPMLIEEGRDKKNNVKKRVDYVMVDEVHVRSTDTELELALLKKANELRKKEGIEPIHILMASATVDQKRLEEYAGGVKAIEVEGKMHEINDNHYLKRDISPASWLQEMPEKAAGTVSEILEKNEKGDVIIFAPKANYLNAIEEKIKKKLAEKELDEEIRIIQLHRYAPDENKKEAEKFPADGVRRIFIGTNFAETGLTINGLKYVINTGLENEKSLDKASGLESLNVIEKSNAALLQCNGRVGRTAPGEVYYLFTKENREARKQVAEKRYPTPEIQRSDLTELLLDMKYRKHELKDLEFLTPQENFKENLAFAEENLRLLGAVDKNGLINEVGKRMVDFQLKDYHLARMLAETEIQNGRGYDQIATIASLLGTESSLVKDRRNWSTINEKFGEKSSDFLTYLNIWNAFRNEDYSADEWDSLGINITALKEAKNERKRLIDKRNDNNITNEIIDNDELGKIITTGLADRIFEYQSGSLGIPTSPKGRKGRFQPTQGGQGSYRIQRKSGCSYNIQIDRNSSVKDSSPRLLVAGYDDTRIDKSGKKIYISLCQEIKPEWLTA